MDAQKYIDKDANGTYCILFQNKAAFTIPEIHEIFSKFGKIYSIQSTGNETGYRFIRYKTHEAVTKAVEGLKNHPQITFAYHKKNKNQKTSQSVNQIEGDNEVKFKNKNNVAQKEMIDKNKQLKNEQKQDSNNLSRISDYSEEGSTNRKNSLIGDNFLRSDNSSEGIHNKIPDLITGNKSEYKICSKSRTEKITNNTSEDKVPDLIKLNQKVASLNMSKKKIISNAEEVIVGNIPSNFGSPYILYLFDRYEPIAISKIYTMKNSIRYCHVYFKTAEDSIAVEKQFDKMELSGHKLLVLRPYRLIEEALA